MSDSVTPWTVACQASLSIANSQSLLKLMSYTLLDSTDLDGYSCASLLFPAYKTLDVSVRKKYHRTLKEYVL